MTVREHLLELERLEANHREHLLVPLLRAQSAARLALYARQRSALETQIRALLRAAPAVQATLQRFMAVCGVGEITAWTAWADMPELGTLAPGQSAALAGLAPHPDDSGQRCGPRHIHGGRATLRRVLYMAAIAAAQHNPILREFYRRLRAKGKPAKLALIAVARRLIELLNLLAQDPNFQLAS